MNAHTRHLRGIDRARFDWSANGDSLPELEPVHAEEFQRELPLTGYRPSWRLFAGFAAFTFIATIVGVHSL